MATTQRMPSDAALLGDNQQEHEEVRTAEPLPPRTKRRSYRILGTHAGMFTSQADSADNNNNHNENDEEDEDPMAWADLEAFGGTKKTLEKKKPLRKLTHEEVKQQLAELQEMDQKMAEGLHEKRSKQSVIDTIAWLKKHSETEAQESTQKRAKRSSSFVRSILNLFSSKKAEGAEDGENNETNNNEDGGEEGSEEFTRLSAPWGQRALNCDWTEVGFGLLNRPILDDIDMVRAVVTSGELLSATPQALIALAKWLQHFDDHVTDVITLKDYLLEERTVIAGVGYKVTTLYDLYKEAKAQALEKLHGDRAELGDAILHMFTELEAILRDEVMAVQDVIKQTLTEEKEYEAISSLFHHLSDDEDCGVIVAKLLGWMKKNLEEADVLAFLALFDHDVQDRIAGEWMRHYASYLHLLDEFSVNFDTSMTFFT